MDGHGSLSLTIGVMNVARPWTYACWTHILVTE